MVEQSRILVVDDEAVIRELMGDILTEEGYPVEAAPNGRAALDLLKQFDDFVLLFTDIVMPEMDGIQATIEIRKAEEVTGGHIPIIALTAYAMSGDKDRFLKAGMDGYLAKPITVDQLRELLLSYGQE